MFLRLVSSEMSTTKDSDVFSIKVVVTNVCDFFFEVALSTRSKMDFLLSMSFAWAWDYGDFAKSTNQHFRFLLQIPRTDRTEVVLTSIPNTTRRANNEPWMTSESSKFKLLLHIAFSCLVCTFHTDDGNFSWDFEWFYYPHVLVAVWAGEFHQSFLSMAITPWYLSGRIFLGTQSGHVTSLMLGSVLGSHIPTTARQIRHTFITSVLLIDFKNLLLRVIASVSNHTMLTMVDVIPIYLMVGVILVGKDKLTKFIKVLLLHDILLFSDEPGPTLLKEVPDETHHLSPPVPSILEDT